MLDPIAQHHAFVYAVEGRRKWTWDIWSMWIDEVEYLTTEGRSVAHWAVSVLEHSLGPNFLHDRKAVPLLEALGLWPLFSRSPIPWDYANLLQFAAEIEILKLDNSSIMKKLCSNLVLEEWAHVQLQLDTACLGLLAGWQAQLEPPLVTGKPGDVCFVCDQRQLFIEARLRHPSRAGLLREQFFTSMVLFIGGLELQYPMHITGEIGEPPPTKMIAQLCQRLKEAAQATSQDGSEQWVEDKERGTRLRVSKEALPAGVARLSMSIPPLSLSLLLECLDEKNDEYRGAVAPWVRIEERAGLWQFSELADLPSPEARLVFLVSYFREKLASSSHLAGMILSPKLLLTLQATPSARSSQIERDGGIAVRCPLPGRRIRETMIIPREEHPTASAEVEMLARWYEKEDDLLNWLLDRSGQPAFNAFVRDPK